MKGITVTLALAGTAYNLFDLLYAIDTGVRQSYREMRIQADPDNGGARVRVGDTSVSLTRCGYALTAGLSRDYRSDQNSIDPHAWSLFTDTDGSLVNVELYEL